MGGMDNNTRLAVAVGITLVAGVTVGLCVPRNDAGRVADATRKAATQGPVMASDAGPEVYPPNQASDYPPASITDGQAASIRVGVFKPDVGGALNRPDDVEPTDDPGVEEWIYNTPDGGILDVFIDDGDGLSGSVVEVVQSDSRGNVTRQQIMGVWEEIEKEKQREIDAQNGFH